MSPLTYAYKWLTRNILILLGVASATLGLAIILGGPARFTSPGFAAARLVPGGCYTWGAVFLVAGLATVGGYGLQHLAVTRVGLLTEAVIFLFFATGIAISSPQDAHAAFTGVVTNAALSMACFMASGVVKVIR